jgi:hypothetical protein
LNLNLKSRFKIRVVLLSLELLCCIAGDDTEEEKEKETVCLLVSPTVLLELQSRIEVEVPFE